MKNLAYYLPFYFLMMTSLAMSQSIPTISSFSPTRGPTGSLFPNPAEERLTIDWQGLNNDGPTEVRILDLTENPVMILTLAADVNSIDVKQLSGGYYFFEARRDNTK